MTSSTEEQEQEQELLLLRQSVATLLKRSGGRDRARGARGNREGVDRAVWSELAEAGILGAIIGEDAGGLGMGLRAGGVIAEEIGRALAPEPFGPVVGLAAGLIARLAPDNDLLESIIGGKTIPTAAWAERNATGISDTVDTEYSNGSLTGKKSWVPVVDGMDIMLVLAQSSGDWILCTIVAGADGLASSPTRQSDGSYLSEVSFQNTPAELLAGGPQVTRAMSAAVDDATALAASELLGVSGQALELTLEFLKTREQFGKPLGSFQALQHRAVDMHMNFEIAAAGIRDALANMDQKEDTKERAREASRAKARACETALKITREAIQMHGAVGYTDEFDVGLYLNRALALSAWLGDANHHRRRWFELNEQLGAEA